MQREIEFLKDLDHPNIIRYYGTSQSQDKLYIYLELASSGSVASLLAKYVCVGAVRRVVTAERFETVSAVEGNATRSLVHAN